MYLSKGFVRLHEKQIRYIFIMNDPAVMPDAYRQTQYASEVFGIYASDAVSDVVRLW